MFFFFFLFSLVHGLHTRSSDNVAPLVERVLLGGRTGLHVPHPHRSLPAGRSHLLGVAAGHHSRSSFRSFRLFGRRLCLSFIGHLSEHTIPSLFSRSRVVSAFQVPISFSVRARKTVQQFTYCCRLIDIQQY